MGSNLADSSGGGKRLSFASEALLFLVHDALFFLVALLLARKEGGGGGEHLGCRGGGGDAAFGGADVGKAGFDVFGVELGCATGRRETVVGRWSEEVGPLFGAEERREKE